MELIGVLCTFLSIFCDIQLIVMGTLPLILAKVLQITGTHLSTIAGVIAAFTAAVTAQMLNSMKKTSKTDRDYTYSLRSRRIATYVSGTLHLIAAILTIVALIVASDLGREFRKLMMRYHHDCTTKALVDNIQFTLQCCGGRNFVDWFETDWGAYQNDVGKKNQHNQQLKKVCGKHRVDSTGSRNDAVPFSCCARAAPSACVHQHLSQLGTSTINCCGCDKKLRRAAHAYLWFELVMYIVSLALEIAVLVLLIKQQHSRKSDRANRKFGEFTNNKDSRSTLSPRSSSSLRPTSSPETKYTTSSYKCFSVHKIKSNKDCLY